MQRLIAEVEAKMKANKSKKVVEEDDYEVLNSSEINFANSQNLSIPGLDRMDSVKVDLTESLEQTTTFIKSLFA